MKIMVFPLATPMWIVNFLKNNFTDFDKILIIHQYFVGQNILNIMEFKQQAPRLLGRVEQ
jgi:hypothetical protein